MWETRVLESATERETVGREVRGRRVEEGSGIYGGSKLVRQETSLLLKCQDFGSRM